VFSSISHLLPNIISINIIRFFSNCKLQMFNRMKVTESTKYLSFLQLRLNYNQKKFIVLTHLNNTKKDSYKHLVTLILRQIVQYSLSSSSLVVDSAH